MGAFDIVLQVIIMLGGLGLFLYGMNMLGNNLEKISGGKLESFLEKMTSNILKGVLVGALVTAAIQSSSATTVIVVGLVNARILKLKSAIGVIMGANIGTTVTGQILRLVELSAGDGAGAALNNLLEIIKPTTLTPVIVVVGIVMYMATKDKKKKILAEILLGFGILFNGMFIMTEAISPMKDLPVFVSIFSTLQNPILGVLAGTIITAILQSSSASVGILQALASTGAITCAAAFPIIMGQNIGTCVTSLISSIGASVNARRAAMVHLYFNIIGTLLFLGGVYIYQYTVGFAFWGNPISMGGIANFHTLFNIIVTLMLIPFAGVLEKLAVLTVKSQKNASSNKDEELMAKLGALDDRFIEVSPSLALSKCSDVVVAMGEFAKLNFQESYKLFEKYDPKHVDVILQREEAIDKMEDKLNSYLLKLSESDLSDTESKNITQILKLLSEFERVGDYAINLVERAEEMYDKKLSLSDHAQNELKVVYSAVEEIIGMAIVAYKDVDLLTASRIEPLEETVDLMQGSLKTKHIERLKQGKCVIETGLIFLEVLTNIERISDHCSNVAVYVIGHAHGNDKMNRHEYIRTLHDTQPDSYALALDGYKNRYFDKLNLS